MIRSLVDQHGEPFHPDLFAAITKEMLQKIARDLKEHAEPAYYLGGSPVDRLRRVAEEVTGEDFSSQKTITFRRSLPYERA